MSDSPATMGIVQGVLGRPGAPGRLHRDWGYAKLLYSAPAP